jgi:lipopolysaccharide/colanic/teichoic acid biosynthesis glycosyltransferase
MLIQLPSGSPDQLGSRNAENCDDAFEAGLRRDLASAQIVSYDAVLGGWAKRAVDLTLSVVSIPIWLPLMLLAAAWGKLRNPRSAVFVADDRIGYGGRHFTCFALSIAPSKATDAGDEAAAPANDWSEIAHQAEGRRAKWRRVVERLPRMFNVLSGDMALVGPTPLPREELEPLKTARRYYLSARPGVVGIDPLVESGDANQFKVYALSWSLTTDLLLLWDALRSLRDRGELWKPSIKRRAGAEIVVRQRTGG